jgi:ABC-type branched-subunit amino acid transport system permease subunit
VNDILPYVIIGITTGSIYSIAAVGLVLTFKTSGVFNFAHGAQAAVGAFVFFEFYQRKSFPWPLAALATLLLVGVVGGLLLERLAAGLAGAPTAARVAATIGLLVGTQVELENIFGVKPLTVPIYLPDNAYEIGGVFIRTDQIIITVLALGSTLLLYWFLTRRRLGVAMQASIENPELLATKGISPIKVRRYAWMIGSCFATASGMLLAPITGLNTSVLTLLVFYAFGAAAVGMFDSLILTYAGGVAIGVGASLLTKWISQTGPLAGLPSTLPFLVLFGALAFAPAGRMRERGTETIRKLPPVPRIEQPQLRLAAATATIAGLVLLPHLVGEARVSLYATALGFLVIFASLALLVRVSGQISLCQMTFAGIGAATFGHASNAGFPWLLALLCAGLAALPAGAMVAIPAFRLSGLYLAMATFGFALLVRTVIFPRSWMLGTFTKVLEAPRPELGGLDLGTDTGYYYVVLALAVACVAFVLGVSRSRLGRLLRAMADAPAAVDAHGTNTNVSKFLVFCISAFVAGIGGALIAPVTGSINSLSYEFSVSLVLVAVLFIAGRRPVLGLGLAAAMYVLVPGYIDNQTVQRYIPVSFGAFAVIAAVMTGRPVRQQLGSWLRRSSWVRTRVEQPEARPRLERLAGAAE